VTTPLYDTRAPASDPRTDGGASVGVRDRTDADGEAVSDVRVGGDPGRGTWRGAELKAPRGVDGLGKARPWVAHGADAEATRHAGAWATRRAAQRAGGARAGAASTGSKRVNALPFERLKLQKFE
jgi:hypothetical protein